jgi:branched-chain amino acid transport system ATP-binding protein
VADAIRLWRRSGGVRRAATGDITVRAGANDGYHRPERRRQDDALQRGDGHHPTNGRTDRVRRRRHYKLPPYRRARLGISRTFANLFPTLAVIDNRARGARPDLLSKFSLFSAPRCLPTRRGRSSTRCARSPPRSRRRASEGALYGEQRQLEIALALVAEPRMLLLDEPAAGLSPSERTMVADIIRALPRSLTVLLIEHDMDLALGLVDRVTCMHEGRIIAEEVPDMIRRNALVQEVYLGKPRHL